MTLEATRWRAAGCGGEQGGDAVVTPAARPARRRLWWVVLAWALWALAMSGGVLTSWLYDLMARIGRPDLGGNGGLAPSLALLSAATVGAVLASRRPGHPVGWLLLAFSVAVGASGLTEAYADYGAVARPGALPAAGFVALFSPVAVFASLALMGFVLLLTPTGSLPMGSGWRWCARVTVAAPVVFLLAVIAAPGLDRRYRTVSNPLDLRNLGGALLVVSNLALAVSLLGFLVAAGSMVLRFRRARGIERQQLR
jgi:hypothetical protein